MANFRIHPHAQERMKERGVTENEVATALEHGEQFPAKFGRTGFRYNFSFDSLWNNEYYKIKQVEVFAVKEEQESAVITVLSKYL